ncbi:ABC transporter permease [Allopusillimonas ginsengisoli]|uniref:ABC transporter permease n=1 Tax=Allopusillimonas ginsengisoli TaxID=453575 RepID=UPI0010200A6D|nr:ABC transporter permease [Allopusillimonas ginsengisoli]TEA79878.1 ABC transporter permease [Allopusillimonas ginsengisoli]
MSSHAIEAAPALPERRRNRAWSKFKRNRSAMLGAAIVLTIIVVAILAPFLSSYDPAQVSFTAIRKAPSATHWLGTDELGRDIFSRMLYGARASLLAGMCSVLIALLAGVPLGLLAGYFGGLIDGCISRATEALLSIPFLILAIALAAFLGPSLTNAMIAIGVSAAPLFIRLSRGQVLAIKNEDYVQSTRSLGASNTRIILRHILPNVMPALIVQATIMIASAIIAEASLSFLGLGLQPPNPSWGSMLNTAKNFMTQAPWMSIFPGGAIFFAVFGFNLLGDGLRDALDPRQDH